MGMAKNTWKRGREQAGMSREGRRTMEKVLENTVRDRLAGYHSMCREMLPDKFDFFLDEMIRLRNKELIRRLEAKGHHPGNY